MTSLLIATAYYTHSADWILWLAVMALLAWFARDWWRNRDEQPSEPNKPRFYDREKEDWGL